MKRTMWAVGPDHGEGWISVNAPTEDAAKDAYAAREDCETEWLIANRVEAWDVLDKITGPDWINNGLGWTCKTCDGMAFADDGAEVIDGEVFCEECASATRPQESRDE